MGTLALKDVTETMALETKHSFYRSSTRATQSRLQESQSVFRIGSDAMKLQYTLQLSYMAIFLSTEDWIHGSSGPKASEHIQRLVWFTGNSGT